MKRDSLTRRSFVRMAGLASLVGQAAWLRTAAGSSSQAAEAQRPKFVFVGAAGRVEGVHVYAITGEQWRLLQIVPSAAPVSLAAHPSGRIFYVLNEVSQFESLPRGSVEAYGLDQDTGQLDLLGRQGLSLSATMPRHMAIAPDGKSLVVAVHGGGAYNLLPVLEDGRVGRVRGILKETGSGPVAEHQETAHPQSIVFDSTGRRVIAADLGSDQVSVISIEDGLEVTARHAMPAGSGPRHLALHPNGDLLYVANALDGSLAGFEYDSVAGRITGRQLQIKGRFGGALGLHPTGEFLFTTARGEITAWRIEAGALEQLQSRKTGAEDMSGIIPLLDGREILILTGKGVERMKFDGVCGRLDQPEIMASVTGARCFAAM
jgi:6-phosphogluconolactonase